MTGAVAALALAAAIAAGSARAIPADEVRVAVAANFLPVLEALEPRFTAATGHRIAASSGSTGTLFAQIEQGAPFEVFLAADSERPRLLAERGRAVPGSRFTYARGRLVLWRGDAGPEPPGPELLRARRFHHLAVANPATAPYGAAALAVLERLGLAEDLRSSLVVGESVAQAFHFVAAGGAELGFVALSQVRAHRVPTGSWWLVPETWHPPIEQQAVLLAAGNPAARRFLTFLASPEAAATIRRFGYEVP